MRDTRIKAFKQLEMDKHFSSDKEKIKWLENALNEIENEYLKCHEKYELSKLLDEYHAIGMCLVRISENYKYLSAEQINNK